MGILLTSYLAFLFLVWLVLTIGGIRGLAGKGAEERHRSKRKPKILLMVPCKGTDIGLERNLRSAMAQDYPNYRAIAIVQSTGDPAFKSIKSSGIDYIIGNFKCRNCSGKVRNLATAIKRFRNYDAYCILDSDTNPASLVGQACELDGRKDRDSDHVPPIQPAWRILVQSQAHLGPCRSGADGEP